ncbi:MAG: MFS transporter [Chloroflexota bacterium]
MTQTSPPDAANKRTVLLVATLSSFLAPFMSSAVNIALPSIGAELAIDALSLSWVATVYLLAAAMFMVPFGRISDIYGRKRVFLYGLLVFTLSSFLIGVARSTVWLILFRAVQGVGAAMIFGTGVAILTSVFPPGERGQVLGLNVAAVYVGLSLGPFLGGLLTEHLGWRSTFLINVPLGMIIIGLVAWQLEGEWAGARGERFDVAGSVIYGLALVLVMYGLSRLPEPLGFGLILAGAVAAIAFVAWERRIDEPVLELSLFGHNLVFAFSNVAALINYSATAAVGFLLSLYLQYIQGLSPKWAGLALVAQPAMQAVFSPFAGRLSDRVEPRIVASLGMLFTFVGLIPFAFLSKGTPLPLLIADLMLLGLGFALFSSPNTNAIMSSVERQFYGVASATLATMRLIGQMLSMGIAMLIFALYIGQVQITAAYHLQFLKSVRMAFAVFALFCFVGIFFSLSRGRLRPQG